MPGRIYTSATYRYGFNGKEKDDEIKDQNNHVDFGWRGYDVRISRMISADPMAKMFSSESPYIYAGDNPLLFTDKEGMTKTLYYTLINKDGSIEHKVQTSVGVKWELSWSGLKAYNYTQNITIDYRDNTRTTNSTTIDHTTAVPFSDAVEETLYDLDGDVKGNADDPTTQPFKAFAMGVSTSRTDNVSGVPVKTTVSTEVYSTGENSAGLNTVGKATPTVSTKGLSTTTSFSNKAYFKFYCGDDKYTPEPTEKIKTGITEAAIELNINLSYFYITNNRVEGSWTIGVQSPPKIGADVTGYGQGVKTQYTTQEKQLGN